MCKPGRMRFINQRFHRIEAGTEADARDMFADKPS